jgi:holo-[acyl-carrier protein] synthase
VIGIDIIKIERIEKLFKKFGNRGLKRFLSENEIKLANEKIERLAGYWAVKEAISKALQVGIGKDFSFHDVEISRGAKSEPIAKLKSEVKDRFLIDEVAISITHDGGFAIAVATISKIRL